MCGIVGYISDRHHDQDLESAVQEMYHRGPDNQQAQTLELSNGRKIGLGHVRLGILDLDPRSNQPFSIDDNKYVIVFNGEIYNYQSIKDDLIKLGVKFRTKSDTEVFLQAYKNYSISCVKKFKGIFTAVIVDTIKNKVFLVRDQFGVKPLYYYKSQNNDLYFASELKALFKFTQVERKISKSDICQFLNMGFSFEPNTGFDNIKKIRPGSFNFVDIDQKLIENIYYQPSITSAPDMDSFQQILRKGIQQQTLADVPVALMFSGGIDSSILASHIGSKMKSLFFESELHETELAGIVDDKVYAEAISKHLKLDMEIVKPLMQKPESFLQEIEHIAMMVEEPISDYTFIASEKLCMRARETGYKVVMSGMGGDEAFAGYPRHILAKNYSLIRKIKYFIWLLKPLFSKIKSFSKKINRLQSFLKEKTFSMSYIRLIGYLSSDEISRLLGDNTLQVKFEADVESLIEGSGKMSYLQQALLIDYHGFLSHNLTVADKSSMLASVEMRVPLLDIDIYQSGICQSEKNLIMGKQQKYILQMILKKILPSNLVSRPKAGFNPPLDHKINQLGLEEILAELSAGKIRHYLNFDVIKDIISRHFSGKENNTYKIWQFLFLNAWLKVWTKSN